MEKPDLYSIVLQIDGTILDMPATLTLGHQNKDIQVYGKIDVEHQSIHSLLSKINKDVGNLVGDYADYVGIDLPDEMLFCYSGGKMLLKAITTEGKIGIMHIGNSTAILIQLSKNQEKTDLIGKCIEWLKKALGIQEFFLYAGSGKEVSAQILIKDVIDKELSVVIPNDLNDCKFLLYGKFHISKGSCEWLYNLLNMLFNIKEVDLNMSAGVFSDSVAGVVELPKVRGGCMEVKDMFLRITFGKMNSIKLSGTFIIPSLKNMEFMTSCEIGQKGLDMSASTITSGKIPLFGRFSLGSTALGVGLGVNGLSFRMYSTLYIGDTLEFGALGISFKSSVMTVDFISAAISETSLSDLIRDICNSKPAFADYLDFLKISDLPLHTKQNMNGISADMDLKNPVNVHNVVSAFNNAVTSEFALDENNTNLERIYDKTKKQVIIATDKRKMRHYSISSDGSLGLETQFYYSISDIEFGEYSLKKGFFLCGSITLFNKFTIKALFSIDEVDGVIAYAAMDKLDLGIIQISKSNLATKDNPLNYFPEKSLLWLLMDKNPAGPVFFLKSGKNECTFYVDGSLTLYKIFSFSARIIYSKDLISIAASFKLANVINVNFAMKAQYKNFLDSSTSIFLEIDCSGLEELLKDTQAMIDTAIKNLREKMNRAIDQINQAKNTVSQLYSQIDNLNDKINNCKACIRNARWYKKAFVAMVKGAEICGYEVAIAGLYAAINVANAALELAKHTVSLADIVGEGVMKAVNSAISCSMKLFFVEYIRLSASLSDKKQKLKADIKFVALGKCYEKAMEIDETRFFNNPSGMIDSSISSDKDVSSDIQNIENGSYKSNRRRYKRTKYTLLENKKQLIYGMDHIFEMQGLYRDIGDIYMKNCGEVFPEYLEVGQDFHHSLGEVESAMALADTLINFTELNQAVNVIESKLNNSSSSVNANKKSAVMDAISQYKEASGVAALMSENVAVMQQHRRTVKINILKTRVYERNNRDDIKPIDIPPEKSEMLINQTEECLYSHFMPTKNSHGYINPGRESVIIEGFSKMRQQEGLTESETVTKIKSRKILSKYDSHL
jgi:hypothetical protein